MSLKTKFLIGVFLVILALMIFGSDDIEDEPHQVNIKFDDKYDVNDNWLVYWYVCGSDLESDGGAASSDIEELLKAKLPSNVKVLIQAGGSEKWHNAFIKAGYTNRYLYDESGLHELETVTDTDMGAPETLAGFLQYGRDNFSADHRVFIFWDHGGGSAFGVCQDERTENVLDLNEIHDAFASVFNSSTDNPPFEVIGFDTCLMATYEMANDLYGFARYMVASEEVEPGNGWEYTGWVSALAQNPALSGAGLGQAICDTYYAGCEDSWTEDDVTLSVMDLSKIPELRKAYENFGIEALKLSEQDPRRFFSAFGRSAKRAENYGGNTRERGYFDMIDLGDLAQKSKNLLPQSAENLIAAINDTVIYKINGIYRDKGSGISGFYPYDGGDEIFSMYSNVYAAPLPQKCLYYHLIYGVMPQEGKRLLANANLQNEQLRPTKKQKLFTIEDLEDTKIQIDNKNNAYVKLSKEQMNILSSVRCNLVYFDEKDGVILNLGSDVNIKVDWDKGTFTDNFDGTWPMLDGHPIYIEVTADEENYKLYSVPIKLNGIRCNLVVAYDVKSASYKILGARRLNTRQGMSDKNLIKLKSGDKITTLHYGMTIDGNDEEYTEVEVDTFTINDKVQIKDETIGDGEYLYCFEFVTPNNESATSQYINFSINKGKITTNKIEE